MRRIVRAAAVLTFAAGAVLATGAGSQAAEAGAQATVHGCPSGAVCLYPGSGWNGDKPEHMYWSYGAHNLVDETGTHRVFNNQTGGAVAQICKEYNGGDCARKFGPGWYYTGDMTPINSIKLSKS